MIHIIGNSHVATMAGNLDHHNTRRSSTIINNINYVWDLDITCWNISEDSLNNIKEMLEIIADKDIIVFGYGSFDIRNNLSFYKNTALVVEKYCNLVYKIFAKYKDMIYFMDPIPPIEINDLYAQQMNEYDIFIRSLDKLSTNRIRLYNIFKDGLSSENLLDWCHLNAQSNEKIVLYLNNIFAGIE